MLVLYIDSSERKNKVIRLVNRKKRDKKIDEITGEVDIVVSIRELLTRNSLTLKDIEEIEFNPGPGSFTGLKVGSTIANILNWSLGKSEISDLIMPKYGKEPNIQR